MVEYYDEQLDLTKARILQLEKELAVQHEVLSTTVDQLKETQRFLLKLAHNQAEISKRISAWPFISVRARDEE